MPETIRFKDKPVTLVGRAIALGKGAPDFRVVSAQLKEVGLSDFKGKTKVVTTFPSLDTPVCDLQVKEFNARAAKLSPEVVIVAISKDLPFAQKRFCDSNSINAITVLSDYKYSSFGINYGLLIKELNLLARSILIIDRNDILRYRQLVKELSTPPDYDDALQNLKVILDNPTVVGKEAVPTKCKPCEAGSPPLPKSTIQALASRVAAWQLLEDKKITREFKFKDFIEAKYFLDLISVIAEEQGHHPTMTIIYNKVKITLTTHAAGGLTENDFIMAGIIDTLGI